MEQNTVVISTEEYNRLRDGYQKWKEGLKEVQEPPKVIRLSKIELIVLAIGTTALLGLCIIGICNHL
jgi:hypothetical protein